MGDYLKACECPPNAAKRCRLGHIECHAALEAFVHPPCPGCAERDQRLAASEAGAAVMRAALEEVRPYVGGAGRASAEEELERLRRRVEELSAEKTALEEDLEADGKLRAERDTLAARLTEAKRVGTEEIANLAQALSDAQEALAERTRELEEARKVIDHPAMSCALDGMMCAKCRITFRDATIERVREALMKAIELAPYGDIERGVSELIQALDAERAKVRELQDDQLLNFRAVRAALEERVADLRAKLAAAEQRALERGTLLTELVDGSVWAREDIREYVAKMRAI